MASDFSMEVTMTVSFLMNYTFVPLLPQLHPPDLWLDEVRLRVPRLPPGLHQLTVKIAGQQKESLFLTVSGSVCPT